MGFTTQDIVNNTRNWWRSMGEGGILPTESFSLQPHWLGVFAMRNMYGIYCSDTTQ